MNFPARVSVQFQSIVDKFSPHDTVFSLAVPSDLTETALSSACLLHAASITSSSSSLRRRRLVEITEDGEEGGGTKDEAGWNRDSRRFEQRKSDLSQQVDINTWPNPPTPQRVDLPLSPARAEPSREKLEPSAENSLPAIPSNVTDDRSNSVTQQHLLENLARPSYDRRQSSQSTRPSAWDLDRAIGYRPKVKVGPRPSLDYNGRPRTSGALVRQNEPRPISTLPAGIRLPSRMSSSHRPKSQSSAKSAPATSTPKQSPPPPVPTPPSNVHISSLYRPPPITTSPRSVPTAPKSPGITPEKQRLMRALQLRKKQMATIVSEQEVKAEEVETKESHPERQQLHGDPVKEASDDLASLPEMSKTDSISDIVHINLGNDKKRASDDPVLSPISMPEGSEGPSTQGSSFTDESEHLTPAADEVAEEPRGHQGLDKAVHEEQLSNEEESTLQHPDPSSSTVHEPHLEDGADLPLSSTLPLDDSLQETKEEARKDSKPQKPIKIEEDVREKVRKSVPQGTLQHEFNEMSNDPEPRGAIETNIEQISSTAGTTDMYANERKAMRHEMVDPIKIVSSAENSDNDLSEDSFMEELKSATVQEALPISVSKSPITPVFSKISDVRRPSDASKASRAASNSVTSATENKSLAQAVSSYVRGRSASAALPQPPSPPQPDPALASKKTNVSSGISKRIKALEMFTSGESSSSPPQTHASPASSTSTPLTSFRKRRSFSQNNNAPNMTTTTSPPKTIPYPSPSPSPESSNKQAPMYQGNGSATKVSHPKKSDSISVTARIIRDPAELQPDPLANPSEPTPLNLQRSPLIVEHEKVEMPRRPSTSTSPKPEPPKAQTRRLSMSSNPGSRRNSFTVPRPESVARRLSLSTRPKNEGILPHSTSDSSSSPDEARDEKKESRKSRLIKRMSSITSNSRRGLIHAFSSTVKEEEAIVEPEATVSESPPQVVDIGDVNIQFPDTLLWKRRFMRIDDQGFLILTPPTMDGNARNIVKRYHLSEFRRPCLPDQDMQELPNSILLDFMDGSTLQCACESRSGQHAVLQSKCPLPTLLGFAF